MNSPLPSCVCVCLCTSGESSDAVQIDLHHGRAGAQWKRQSRTVSSTGDMGEPIAFKHHHNMTDSLLPFRLRFPPEPVLQLDTLHKPIFLFVIMQYCLWLVLIVSLGLRSCSVSVMCVCFALNESCVFRSSLLYVAALKQPCNCFPKVVAVLSFCF